MKVKPSASSSSKCTTTTTTTTACCYFKTRRRRCRFDRWMLVGLSIFLYIWQRQHPQQQQQHFISTTTTTVNTNNDISNTSHEQQGVASSSSSSLLFVNHSLDHSVMFERIKGCSPAYCRLAFVHIPKTGGTAVELAGAVANIPWGACRFYDNFWVDSHHRSSCPNLTTDMTPRLGKHHHRILPHGAKVNGFHLPSYYFDEPQFRGRNPYHHHGGGGGGGGGGADADDGKNVVQALFAIVRDPYARAISEYYHIKTRGGANWNNNDDANKNSTIHNAAVMNHWLALHLTPMMKIYDTITTTTVNNTTTGPEAAAAAASAAAAGEGEHDENHHAPAKSSKKLDAVYYQKDGHFIPQFDYIFHDPDLVGVAQQAAPAPAPRIRRVVHHVLHFEHLHVDFAKLMAAYNLSFVVLPDPEHQPQQQQQQQQSHQQQQAVKDGGGTVLVARKTPVKKLDKYNLTLDNIRRIETIYARDFATFGYPTISSEMEKKKKKK